MRFWLSTCLLSGLLAFAPRFGTAADTASQASTSISIVYFDLPGNKTLDPAAPQNASSHSHEVLLALYDTLIRMNDAGLPGPGLAEAGLKDGFEMTQLLLNNSEYRQIAEAMQAMLAESAFG